MTLPILIDVAFVRPESDPCEWLAPQHACDLIGCGVSTLGACFYLGAPGREGDGTISDQEA